MMTEPCGKRFDGDWRCNLFAGHDGPCGRAADPVSPPSAPAEPAFVPAGEARQAEQWLRSEWWMNHGCPVGILYGDDGEMQCSACRLDFRRMPLDKLRAAVSNVRLAATMNAAEPVDAPRATPSEPRLEIREPVLGGGIPEESDVPLWLRQELMRAATAKGINYYWLTAIYRQGAKDAAPPDPAAPPADLRPQVQALRDEWMSQADGYSAILYERAIGQLDAILAPKEDRRA